MNSRASAAISAFFHRAKLHSWLPRVLRGGIAIALSVLLVPLSEGDLFAQQAPPDPGQYAAPDQQVQPYYDQQAPAYGQQAPYPQTEQQEPVYPAQPEQAYPPQQQPAYPEEQPGYPQQPAYPEANQGYPQQGYGEAPAAPEEAYGSPDNGEQGYPQPQYAPQQPLSPGQLEQLVAPIALYPDGLVAQVLAASTYPLQITDAARWRQAQSDAAPEQIAAEADGQNWDPSVKALTAFPQVLAQMADNLSWTTELGNAYYNQPQDVLTAVQTMRQRAQSAGNLQNTPQETVTDNQGYVQVEPANPEVVYVPTYDPWAVYGAPVAPYPGYSVLNAIGDVVSVAALGAAVYFGVGMVMSAFARMTWGFFGWGCNWFGDALMFHGGYYSPHSWTVRDWGLAHGGPRYFGRFAGSRGFGGRYEARGGYGGARNGYAARGFAGNRTAEGYRGGYGRNLQAESRMPAFNARGNYGRTGGYASNGNLVRSARGNAWSGAARSGNVGRYSSPAYGRSEGFANRMVASGDRYGSSYGPGFYGRSGSSYGYRGETAGRAGAPGYGRSGRQAGFGGSFRGTSPSYRASTNGFRGSEFGGSSFGARSSRSFGGFSRSSSRGAFGGGHAARSFGGGGHFSGGSHFGGGGHFSGGHSGGHGGGHRR